MKQKPKNITNDLSSVYIKPSWCPQKDKIEFKCSDCDYFNKDKIKTCNYKPKKDNGEDKCI